MALGPTPDMAGIVLAVLKGTHNGTAWNNKHYLQYTGSAPSSADLVNVGTAIGTAWNTNVAPLCHANVGLDTVELADLTSRTAATGTASALAHVGSRAGTDVPNQVAMVVSWKINKRYRGGHPRSYWPAGVLADITSGRLWAGGFVTAATAGATAYRTALNAIAVSGTTYKMVSMNLISHDPITKALRYVTPPVPVTINSAVVHGRVDTQRRRLGRETP